MFFKAFFLIKNLKLQKKKKGKVYLLLPHLILAKGQEAIY